MTEHRREMEEVEEANHKALLEKQAAAAEGAVEDAGEKKPAKEKKKSKGE